MVCLEEVYKYYNLLVIVCIVDVMGCYYVYVVWFDN